LAFARLVDDAADGECEVEPATARELAATLEHLASAQYLSLFEGPERGLNAPKALRFRPASERAACFQSYFRRYLDEWLQVTWAASDELAAELSPRAALPGAPRPEVQLPTGHRSRPQGLPAQASRGAFLKIGCAAAYLLADREEELAHLELALEHLLVGVIMLDERFDWVGDLASSRYNVFVAHCSDLGQTHRNRDANRRAVLAKTLLGDADASYFALLQGHLDQARQGAERAGCAGLAGFIIWYATETDRCRSWFLEQRNRFLG
jgi:hypothetical protein